MEMFFFFQYMTSSLLWTHSSSIYPGQGHGDVCSRFCFFVCPNSAEKSYLCLDITLNHVACVHYIFTFKIIASFAE